MIDYIREYCLSLPLVSEDIKWGNVLCFSLHSKLFLVISLDEVSKGVSLKVSDENFAALTEEVGYVQAPYFAKMKWIKVLDINCLSRDRWKFLIDEAYTLIKIKHTKKVQFEIDTKLSQLLIK